MTENLVKPVGYRCRVAKDYSNASILEDVTDSNLHFMVISVISRIWMIRK